MTVRIENFPQIGWLPKGYQCSVCGKRVFEHGGVFCGRQRSGVVHGCASAVCWRCMNKAPKNTFGGVRTTKAEFTTLGLEAWWMHEACMDDVDKRDYYEKEE